MDIKLALNDLGVAMPKNLLSPEEVAAILRVEPADIVMLIDEGTLRAYRFGRFVRIAEDDLERCLETCATSNKGAGDNQPTISANTKHNAHQDSGERLCKTFAGRRAFRVSGHVDTGAQIWPGDMRYPIAFPKDRFDALLAYGRSRAEMRVGATFSGPEEGSLGRWIQENLPTKMNPATYVAGLLIDEGYAERARAGVIRFFSKRRTSCKENKENIDEI